jgi:transcriptional regulator GlxA family with amidase domain
MTLTASGERAKNHTTGGVAANRHLQRAEEYIHAHLSDAFSLHDLAEATGTSPSTLLRIFSFHFGVSPMQFVKRLRLDATRRTLLHADPEILTVGQVAGQFGFRQLGRFAGDYRRMFGELPSATLRRHRPRLSHTKGI